MWSFITELKVNHLRKPIINHFLTSTYSRPVLKS